MDEFELRVEEEPECEHCGALEPNDVVFDEGGVTWCLDCAKYNDDFTENFSEDDINKAKVKSYKAKHKYFKEKLEFYEIQLKKLGV